MCGGLIHPIAGKCKHCKTDLVAMRGHREVSAPAALPALGPMAAAALPMPPPPEPAAPPPLFAAAPALQPSPTMLAATPIAPTPRATGQQSAWSRRWPLMVVAVAAVAIVVSIVLLVLPDKTAAAAHRRRTPIPAPELDMNREPVRPPGTDPWGSAPSITPPGQPSPQAPPSLPQPPPTTGQIDPDDDDIDIPPPGGGIGGGSISGRATAPADGDKFPRAIAETLCERVTACVGGGPASATTCRQMMSMFDDATSSTTGICPTYNRAKAQRCLSTIEDFPCATVGGRGANVDLSKMTQIFTSLPECVEACS